VTGLGREARGEDWSRSDIGVILEEKSLQ